MWNVKTENVAVNTALPRDRPVTDELLYKAVILFFCFPVLTLGMKIADFCHHLVSGLN